MSVTCALNLMTAIGSFDHDLSVYIWPSSYMVCSALLVWFSYGFHYRSVYRLASVQQFVHQKLALPFAIPSVSAVYFIALRRGVIMYVRYFTHSWRGLVFTCFTTACQGVMVIDGCLIYCACRSPVILCTVWDIGSFVRYANLLCNLQYIPLRTWSTNVRIYT